MDRFLQDTSPEVDEFRERRWEVRTYRGKKVVAALAGVFFGGVASIGFSRENNDNFDMAQNATAAVAAAGSLVLAYRASEDQAATAANLREIEIDMELNDDDEPEEIDGIDTEPKDSQRLIVRTDPRLGHNFLASSDPTETIDLG